MNAQLAPDPVIAKALEAAFPVDPYACGDWSTIETHRSTLRRTQLRPALVPVVAAIVVCAVVLPAVAAINDWWFFGPGAPTPTGAVAEIASDPGSPPAWVMNAYMSDHGICSALTETSGVAHPLAAEGCDPNVQQNGVSYVFATSYDGATEYLFGPTSADANSVRITFADGSSQSVQTISSNQIAGYRFYVTKLPAGAKPVTVAALTSGGAPLGSVSVGSRTP